MPITEEQMTYEEMKKVVKNPCYKCGECGGGLTLAWIKGWVIRCGNNIEHGKITKYDRQEAEFMSEVKEQAGLGSVALAAMSETAMVERVDKAKFVELCIKEVIDINAIKGQVKGKLITEKQLEDAGVLLYEIGTAFYVR